MNLLIAQSCLCFSRVSKTFYVKVDATEASTRNAAELLRQDGAARKIEEGFGTTGSEIQEFAVTIDSRTGWCVLRGGFYKKSGPELRSYLRLIRVPQEHRPPDFDILLVQIEGLVDRVLS